MKTTFKLIRVEDDHSITKSSDNDFMLLVQRAVLLGLKDAGALNEMQYRQAENGLLRQYREDVSATDVEECGND